jgi:tRNA (uracil-5-)-methyltransferase TRM9
MRADGGGSEVPDAEAVYDAIAEAWVRTQGGPWRAVTGFLEGVRRGARLVDVGAGSGRYLSVEQARGLCAVGLDISRGQLAVAKRTLPAGSVLVRADARALPLKDGVAGAALCIAVVHHFFEADERVRALSEVRRVLKEGGRALVSAWGSEAVAFQNARRLEGGGRHDFIVPFKEKLAKPADRFFHAYEAGELEREGVQAGFESVLEWTERENRFAECVR